MLQFGRTWWGEQWLQALDRIDFSNRLPRGKSYAKNGKVSSININENVIHAKVLGSRPKPYDVTVIVPPFFEEEQKIMIESIKNNPLLLSQLLNRQLPQELLKTAEEKKIKIFPQSWQDIKLNCSCPDWAVPCKHLAAVIYMVANEIDQNPFMVFDLHRFNLLESLGKFHVNLYELQSEKIFSLNDCISEEKSKVKVTKVKNTKKNLAQDKKTIAIPDFSIIENLLSTLPLLYTSNPLFYTSDFKVVIANYYKRQAKYESQYLGDLKKSIAKVSNDFRYFEFTFTLNESGTIVIQYNDDKSKAHIISLNDLLILLAKTESKHLDIYSASFIYLYRCFRFCNILAERAGYLPRLFHVRENKYQIQWIPAILNESIKKVSEDLLLWYPTGMVLVETKNDTAKIRSLKNLSLCKPEEAQILICSMFLNASIKNTYVNNYTNSKSLTKTENKINQLFFDDQIMNFSEFSEKETPNTIQLWLNRFFISRKYFEPILQISELNENSGFEVEVLMKDKSTSMHSVESFSQFMRSKHVKQFEALKDLQLLAHYLPDLNTIISSQGLQKLKYNSQTFSEILISILPVIRLFGIQTLLPKSLQRLLHPQLSVGLKIAKGKNKSFFSLSSLIDFDWKIAIGNTFLDPDEFINLTRQSAGLVKIKDQYVFMKQDDVEKIIKKLSAPSAPKSFTLLQAALSGDYNGAEVLIDANLKKKISEILKEDKVCLPKKMNAELRPYQVRGFGWLYKNSRLGLGSILADDMGLGKTLQVITTLQKFKEEGSLKNSPALVIAPTTLLSNWKSEIEKFAPSLQAILYHGSERKDNSFTSEVIITTYGIVRSENEKFSKQKWHSIIIDEAQNIKNSETAQTKAVKKINASIKIAMSGTPVENRLMEYWSIFDFANPGYLGSTNWFNDEYAKPIEINQDKKRLEKFRKITEPFVMRRLKTDKTIISDLPDKIENNLYANLGKEQASLYKSITTDLLEQIEATEGINRRGIILKLLTILKQVCNHPLQYLKNNSELKPEHSGKMLLLLQLLETIYENNEKVLIFSQYMEMGNLIRNMIHNYFGKKPLQLHGGNTRSERDEMVRSFQNNSMNDTFILSLKAGGTGLNLTAASHVIHYDLWWNPAVEAQATDRAFRIGQKKNVMVHRLITKGTLEEKIDDMLKNKRKLANLAVSSGEKWIGELSDKEIKQLVSLEF